MTKKIIFYLLCVLIALPAFAEDAPLVLPGDEQKDIAPEFGPEHEKELDALFGKLGSSSSEEREKAAFELRSKISSLDLPKLLNALKGGNRVEKQVHLIRLINGLRDWRAAEALRFEIELGQEDAVLEALLALGNLKYDWGVPILSKELTSAIKGKKVRRAKRAASALGVIGTPRAIDALKIARVYDSSIKNSIAWASDVALKKVDLTKTDDSVPQGRKVELYFKGTRYFFYHPGKGLGLNFKPWLYVCIHDDELNVEKTFDKCMADAKEYKFAALVPYFDDMTFPEYSTFNIYGERSDKRLIELVEFLGAKAGVESREFFLNGEGAGGGFVERFALTYPSKVARATITNPNVTFLSTEEVFPWGTETNPFAHDLKTNLYGFMKTNMGVFYSGEKQLLPQEEKLKDQIEKLQHENGVWHRFTFVKIGIKQPHEGIPTTTKKYLFDSVR